MSNTESTACPYLGLRDDPNSHMAFISPLNCCRCSKSSPAPVKLDHQNKFCLTGAYPTCPVYQGGKQKPFPHALREHTRANRDYRSSRQGALNLIPLLVAVVLLAVGYWLWNGYNHRMQGLPIPSWTVTASSTPTELSIVVPGLALSELPSTETLLPDSLATVTPFPSLTPTFFTETPTLTPTQTLTRTPRPTYTPTPPSPTATLVSIHSLEVPIGRVQQYLIHRVIKGENLDGLTDQYNTSIEAILQVNYQIIIPLWEDALIVFPLGITDPAGLPVFEPYQVKYAEITVEALADDLGIDPVMFKYYNMCNDGEVLRKGDWMLVPR